MSLRERVMFMYQAAFGLPILVFTLYIIYEDAAGHIDVDKFGYAFFGGIITHFLYYFFRKGIEKDTKVA